MNNAIQEKLIDYLAGMEALSSRSFPIGLIRANQATWGLALTAIGQAELATVSTDGGSAELIIEQINQATYKRKPLALLVTRRLDGEILHYLRQLADGYINFHLAGEPQPTATDQLPLGGWLVMLMDRSDDQLNTIEGLANSACDITNIKI